MARKIEAPQETREPWWQPSPVGWGCLCIGAVSGVGVGTYTALNERLTSGIYVGLIPFGLGILCAALVYRARNTPPVTTSEDDVRAREEEDLRRVARNEELWSKWYVRYPFAALLLWLAFYELEENGEKAWWLAAGLAVWAAIRAWELTLFAIGAWLLLLLVDGLEKISVQMAIVIGAIIIAAAVQSRR